LVDVRDARPHPTSTGVCHFDGPYPKFPRLVKAGRRIDGPRNDDIWDCLPDGADIDSLSDGVPLYRAGLKPEWREILAPYFLLTNRQVLAVVNVGEDELDRIPAVEDQVRAEFTSAGDNVEVIGMCVQLEAEAATIEDPAERAEMLEGFGLGEGALFRMVRAAYHLLGLRTFLTTGDKESRAWTFKAGWKAPECAGVIHTDLQRGFIRAEVIRWDELLDIGSWTKAREAGKLRVEGKDYEVQDGDVLEIRHSS